MLSPQAAAHAPLRLGHRCLVLRCELHGGQICQCRERGRHAAHPQRLGLNTEYLAATQPGWVQLLEILIISDFLAYWFHRYLHRYVFLWR